MLLMRYVRAKFAERQEVKAYRIYVSDSLQAIAQNTARFNGGSIIKRRFADLVYQKTEIHSSAEIITNLKAKLKKVGERNGI